MVRHRSAVDAATREVLHDVGRLAAGRRRSAAPPAIGARGEQAAAPTHRRAANRYRHGDHSKGFRPWL
eukprot:2603174-Prymnesium_polylepis.1